MRAATKRASAEDQKTRKFAQQLMQVDAPVGLAVAIAGAQEHLRRLGGQSKHGVVD